jgi:hypothetical protein
MLTTTLTASGRMQPDMQEWPIYGGDAGGAKFLRSC